MTDVSTLEPAAAPAPEGVKVNTWAKVAIVSAIICAPVGLICGASALGKIREGHERGKGMAIVAMALGGLGTLVAIFVFVAATGVFSSPPQCAYPHLPAAPSGQHWVCKGVMAHTVTDGPAAQ